MSSGSAIRLRSITTNEGGGEGGTSKKIDFVPGRPAMTVSHSDRVAGIAVSWVEGWVDVFLLNYFAGDLSRKSENKEGRVGG